MKRRVKSCRWSKLQHPLPTDLQWAPAVFAVVEDMRAWVSAFRHVVKRHSRDGVGEVIPTSIRAHVGTHIGAGARYDPKEEQRSLCRGSQQLEYVWLTIRDDLLHPRGPLPGSVLLRRVEKNDHCATA